MPVVRISDELFKRLQAHAAPLVDSVSDVLARMVDAYEGISPTKGAQAKPVESLSALDAPMVARRSGVLFLITTILTTH